MSLKTSLKALRMLRIIPLGYSLRPHIFAKSMTQDHASLRINNTGGIPHFSNFILFFPFHKKQRQCHGVLFNTCILSAPSRMKSLEYKIYKTLQIFDL